MCLRLLSLLGLSQHRKLALPDVKCISCLGEHPWPSPCSVQLHNAQLYPGVPGGPVCREDAHHRAVCQGPPGSPARGRRAGLCLPLPGSQPPTPQHL